MKIKVSQQDIQWEIERMKRSGYTVKPLSTAELKRLTREANGDSYYIMNEGLWAWLFRRVVID